MYKKTEAVKMGCLAWVLMLSLAGCGSGGQGAESGSTAAAGGKTETAATASNPGVETIRVWTNDANLQLLYDEAVAEFNGTVGKEKGIAIEYQVFGSDYNDVLKVALAADQGPELYKFVGTTKDSFVEGGWMVALEDMPGSGPLLEQWSSVIIPGYNTYKGKTYSLPVKALNTKFLYNKTLLEKNGFQNPPKTWEEMTEMAKTITANGKGEEYGFGLSLKDAGSSGKWLLATQFASSVGHMGFDFKTGEYRFRDFQPVVEYLQKMRQDGSMFPGFEALSNDGLSAHFAEGRIAFTPGVTWHVNTYNNSFEMKNEWGVFQTPVVDQNNAYKSYAQLADMMCIGPAANKMPEKTLAVYEFLHNDQILLDMQEQGIEFVGLESIQKRVTTPPDLVGWKEFADTSKSYFSMTPPDGTLELEGQTYQNVLVNMLASDMTPDEIKSVLEDLDSRYQVALEKAVEKGLDLTPFIDPNWDTRLK